MKYKFIKILIEIGRSKIQGVGVIAASNLRKGQKIADGVHSSDFKYIISWKYFKSYSKDVREKVNAFCIGTPEGFVPPECNDFNKLSIEWFMNHSCDGNVGFDKKGDFVAIKDIKKGTELCYDYALIESNPKFKMKCNCRSKNCRGNITGNDWKKEKFWNKNFINMHPVIQKNLNKIYPGKLFDV